MVESSSLMTNMRGKPRMKGDMARSGAGRQVKRLRQLQRPALAVQSIEIDLVRAQVGHDGDGDCPAWSTIMCGMGNILPF